MAEMELMSSTSHDVCEMWTGSQIVQVMGVASSTTQLLYFPKHKREVSCGIYTLEDAIGNGILKQRTTGNYISHS